MLTTVALTGVLLLVLGSLISASVRQLSENSDLYSSRLATLGQQLHGALGEGRVDDAPRALAADAAHRAEPPAHPMRPDS